MKPEERIARSSSTECCTLPARYPVCTRSDPAVEQFWTSLPTWLLDDLELAIVDGVADVSVDSGSVNLVPIDLATSELRDQHRGINGALLSGETAALFQETPSHCVGD